MVVLMVRGGFDVIVSQTGKFSLDATGPPLPVEPTSTHFQTGRRGLNQTHEPQNMTWRVQQEKRGGGETQCELIELHLAEKTKQNKKTPQKTPPYVGPKTGRVTGCFVMTQLLLWLFSCSINAKEQHRSVCSYVCVCVCVLLLPEIMN